MDKQKANKYWENMAAILSHMKRFQKAVVDARKKWGIPYTGLPREKRADWYKSLFNTPDANLSDNYYPSWQNEILPPNETIRSTLKEISRKFNLDSRWHHNLLLYIASGDTKLTPPFGLPYVDIRVNDSRLPQDKWIVKRIWIEIFPDTTLDDIRKIWKQVQEGQALMPTQLPKKRRPIGNIDKYIRVRELEDEGLSQKEIAENHPELGFLTYKDVSDFKKQIEEHFSPRKVRK